MMNVRSVILVPEKAINTMTLIELAIALSDVELEMNEGYTYTNESLEAVKEEILSELEKRQVFLDVMDYMS